MKRNACIFLCITQVPVMSRFLDGTVPSRINQSGASGLSESCGIDHG